MELNAPPPSRLSIYHKLIPSVQPKGALHHKPSIVTTIESATPSRSETPLPRVVEPTSSDLPSLSPVTPTVPNPLGRRISYANPPVANAPGYTPILESVDHAIKDTGIQPLQLPGNLTTDEFTRAVAVATVSALRHQQTHSHFPARLRASGAEMDQGGHGGHDAPSWSRTTSASVLLACTALYAIIAGAFMRNLWSSNAANTAIVRRGAR